MELPPDMDQLTPRQTAEKICAKLPQGEQFEGMVGFAEQALRELEEDSFSQFVRDNDVASILGLLARTKDELEADMKAREDEGK